MSNKRTTAYRWLLLVLLWAPQLQAAPPTEYLVSAQSSGGSGFQTRSKEWMCRSDYPDIQGYADRPDGQTIASLTVLWEKPEIDALGNICTIRGQLRLPAGDGQTQPARPATWFQGVTIYLATTPGASPDWSAGMDRADTLDDTIVTSPFGRFELRFDLRETKRDRTADQELQLGLALAKHKVENKTRQEVLWYARAPAVASSVQMLAVPTAVPLSRELELINRASGWPFKNRNGGDLIRAASAIAPLGKRRALAVLEQYLELTDSAGHVHEYYHDKQVVFWIVRLLFQPDRPDGRIPPPKIAVWLDDSPLNWPLSPMAVAHDVPFMVGHRNRTVGVDEHPSSHIEWARQHGALRARPLAPTANPLAAAQSILGSEAFQGLSENSPQEVTRSVRAQALSMAGKLIAPRFGDESPIDERLDDELWQAQLYLAAERGIHWDAQREQFTSGE